MSSFAGVALGPTGPLAGVAPLLSVVITTHGEAKDLPVILGCLANQRVNVEVEHSRQPGVMCRWALGERCLTPYETIVTTDGPYEGTLALREMFNILVECPKQGGVGHHTRGPGLEAASGEWIVITNSDNFFMYGWLDLLSQAMARPHNGIVYWNGVNNLWNWGIEPAPGNRSPAKGTMLARGYIDLSFCAIRTQIAKQVGFPWSHYDADYDYIYECSKLMETQGFYQAKLNHVLSVHN